MKIAIHKGDGDFSTNWIKYCDNNLIPYKVVNAYDSDIIEQIADCDAFMWHHNHGNYRDLLFAKELLAAVEACGKVVFPNHDSGWHFDDKVGEKYLFEALGLNAVPAYVFYDKETAEAWANSTSYPKVFKLRGGAGAMNVMLVKSRSHAHKIIGRCFGRGFKVFRPMDYLKDRYNKWREGQDTLLGVIKAIGRFIFLPKDTKLHQVQKGYAYFQEFMPNNEYDTRVVVIAGKYAMAEKRYVRKGDFRASGSGKFDYSNIDTNIIKAAFDAAKLIKAQSIAFDFIYDDNRQGKIVETSYCFGTHGISNAPGFWSVDMQWHPTDKPINLWGWMVECVINELKQKPNN